MQSKHGTDNVIIVIPNRDNNPFNNNNIETH